VGIPVGAVLVVLTWILALAVLSGFGLVVALAVSPSRKIASLLRLALWWGLGLISVLALIVSLFTRLGGPTAAVIVLVAAGFLGTVGFAVLRRRAPVWGVSRPGWGGWLLVSVLTLASVYLAVAALGPVTNYDSGLYHLGAIRYAADYPAIPGLANLYFPFGYGTAHFPLAALLTNGPWGVEGFRLLNGLILTMASIDLALRALQRKLGPGFYVLAVGMTATLVPMVALSDYWVTSPSQDSTALALTVVASAYLTDAIRGTRDWLAAASTSIVIATTLTLIRPTAGTYLVGLLVILMAVVTRRRVSAKHLWRLATLSLGVGVIALVATTARDRVLSGWFQYPLSVMSFEVPWRAADPTAAREATLGFHRNPADLWNSIDSWNWVGPWLTDRIPQWETYELLAMFLVAAIAVPLAVARAPKRRIISRIALSVAPSAVAVVVWWGFTPPSYRFAWGALITLASVPIGWSLWSLLNYPSSRERPRNQSQSLLLAALAAPVLMVVVFSSAFRLNIEAMNEQWNVNVGVEIPVAIAPVLEAPVRTIDLEASPTLLVPTESDQCWGTYPLCTPAPDPRLGTLDGPWPRGFVAD
jgi:hypothetical protein